MQALAESLVERLGLGAGARAVIVNCDDIGSSHSANLASLEAMEKGLASSATLMVPCPWAREAIELFAGRDVGVHLTLTAEYPTYRWRSLTGAPSLHDAEGFLPRQAQAVWERADLADVARECRAQIDQALDWGVDVTHLDAHMGTMQIDPRYYEIYLQLGAQYRLPLRMAGARAEAQLGFPIRAPAARLGLVFPDDFVFRWGDSTAELMRRRLPNLASGVTEFIVHPVLDGPELRAYDLTEAQIRIDDHACAVSPAIAALIEAQGIRRISYRPLRELQRANGA
ncbi:MAG TPA: polysaccharide deacetylase family protein [Caulobacteraceae bacterium]|nr:polysaccharide deacetylase family protein [Caulobacteraceae bacterium]